MGRLIGKYLFGLCLIFLVLLTLGNISAENATDANATSVSTYTDLSSQISNAYCNETLNLTQNYKFNNQTDSQFTYGVKISKSITIVGNGNVEIDGNNLARGITINKNCNVVLENITFRNCYCDANGGAIILGQNSNLTIRNCMFYSNMVYNANGGAIYCNSGTNTVISDSVFFNNTSIRESVLEWTKFKKGMGSALTVGIDSNMTLSGCKFIANEAYVTTILIISYNDVVHKISRLYINDCLFENNTSKHSGIIYLDELGQGEILNSVFRNNHATESGGIVVLDAPLYSLVKNCLFEENVADRGGGINIKTFEDRYALNVTVDGCNFTRNRVSANGGAIYAKSAILTILNSIFKENTAGSYGGAICASLGSIMICDSNFNGNSANYGGAASISSENINVRNLMFNKNSALSKGGGIYSKIPVVSSTNCRYISNIAPKGANVYGVFVVKVSQTCSYFGGVELKITLTSPWKDPLSQKIKLKFKGSKSYSTDWIKMPSSGVLKLKVPVNLNVGKYSLTIKMDSGICEMNPTTIKVVKAPSKLNVKKTTAHYKSGKLLKVYVKNKKTNKRVSGAKLKLSVYTGTNHFTCTITANEKGLATYDTSKLSLGNHKIKITRADKNIQVKNAISSIKIVKTKAKVIAPKSVEKPSKAYITVKHKSTDKAISKVKLNVKIYTGKNYKSLKVKTDSKGVFKIDTKKLSRGNHKIAVTLKDNNYNINKKFSLKIK